MKVLLSPSHTLATFVILLSLTVGSFSTMQQRGGVCVSGEKSPPASQTNYFALVIGNDAYAPPVKNLKTAGADA